MTTTEEHSLPGHPQAHCGVRPCLLRQAGYIFLAPQSLSIRFKFGSQGSHFCMCRWKGNLSEEALIPHGRHLAAAPEALLVLQLSNPLSQSRCSHAAFLGSLCRLKALQTLDALAVLVTLQEPKLCQRPVHPETVPGRVLRNQVKPV